MHKTYGHKLLTGFGVVLVWCSTGASVEPKDVPPLLDFASVKWDDSASEAVVKLNKDVKCKSVALLIGRLRIPVVGLTD